MSLVFSGASSVRNKVILPAAIGLGLLVLGFLIDRHQFFLSYLQGYMFALAFPVGCLGLTMVHNLSGGKWGWTIRPFLEAGIKTLPALSLLFIPVALGVGEIYPWTNHELMAHDAALASKAGYLNVPFWLYRAVGYFAIWNILGIWLLKWLMPTPASVTTDIAKYHRVQRLSAGGMLVLVLSLSFAAIDWLMSIEPHWFSSIFGGIVAMTCAMSAFCFCTMSAIWMHRKTPNPWLTERNLHDLSKFIFMTVMVWGYFNLSQFLIIWSGNLPEETFWYYERSQGAWFWMSSALPLLQWFLPFCLILPASRKKNPDFMVKVCWFLLIGRAFEQIWLVAPSTHPAGTFPIHWMDIASPIGLGCAFAALFFGFLGRSSGIPAPAADPHHHGGPQDKPQGGTH